MTLQEANRSMQAACARLDPMQEQTAAYVGWLLTNSLFLAERDAMRLRWADAIQHLESFPPWPVSASPDAATPKAHKRKSKNLVDEFVADWKAFLARWELQTMATWDLPEPNGSNLSGLALPSSVAQPPNRITLELSPVSRMPGSFSLGQLQEEIQRHQTPPHLQPWLDVLNQQHGAGLRFQRLGHLFELVFYRDTVLASRYADRFKMNVGQLDKFFAAAWSRDVDSVKKLRLHIGKLRRSSG